MPDVDPLLTDSEVPGAPSNPMGGPSLLGKLGVFVFLATVVLAECLAAYLFLPDASETVAVASAVSHPKSETELPDDRSSELEAVDQVEVDLEEFSVTAFQPASGTTLRIDFHLYGTVATQDVAQFRVLMEKSVHRFREQVIVIVRSAELTDLTDAGLGLIKRRILEKTNRMLGEPLLKSVIVSDYSFIEQ